MEAPLLLRGQVIGARLRISGLLFPFRCPHKGDGDDVFALGTAISESGSAAARPADTVQIVRAGAGSSMERAVGIQLDDVKVGAVRCPEQRGTGDVIGVGHAGG